MNLSEPGGESSCKRQENGDVPSGSERPLKKARFAWQVKGKYHLKNESSDSSTSSIRPYNVPSEAGSVTVSDNANKDLVGTTEQNLEILGDYLLKQDFNTLDSVITDSEKSLLKPSTSVSADKLAYPRYISSYENKNTRNINNNDMAIPMSMVISQNYTEDQCIARWQARQMAKGFVDNTINRVLDSWMVAPIPQEIDNNRFIALDVAEFINNLPGDNSIENEGILMAISAHGLQNTSVNKTNSTPDKTVSLKDDQFTSPRSSPVPSDDEIVSELQECKQDTEMSSSEPDLSWSYNNDSKRNNSSPFALFPDTSDSSYHYFSENDPLQASPYGDSDLNSHHDFLDAAVSFAIQNKGLTSFGTDYG